MGAAHGFEALPGELVEGLVAHDAIAAEVDAFLDAVLARGGEQEAAL